MLKERIEMGMACAIDQARKSLAEGGIPIGAALVDDRGRLLGAGHNQRVQQGSQILHGEIDCLAKVGRRASYTGTILYTTLMPCHMCAGAIVQFGIPRVIVGEARSFKGAVDILEAHGVEVRILDLPECQEMLEKFIEEKPEIWFEDIGR